jgi:hypothetical protein
MAYKNYRGTPPYVRFNEARALADLIMAGEGYWPCKGQFQPASRLSDDGSIVRLYTTHESGSTNYGGISIGMAKATLMEPDWTRYVEAQVRLALSRKV